MATITGASRHTVAIENFNTLYGRDDLSPYARGIADGVQPILSRLTSDDIEGTIAAIEKAIADASPKIGDMHPWDALVDGCLYQDDGAEHALAFALDGHASWVCNIDLDEPLGDGSEGNYVYSNVAPQARVVAVNLKTLADVKAAAAAWVPHHHGG